MPFTSKASRLNLYVFYFPVDSHISNVRYTHLLYTHQCIAQNISRTEQWNTNQRIAFSVSPIRIMPV